MMVKYAADPCDSDACKMVKLIDSAEGTADFISCLLGSLAFMALLGDIATLRGLTGSDGLTFLDIARSLVAGAGAYFLAQASFTYLHGLLLRKYLQAGAVLRLDESIADLDLSKCKDATGVRFRLQKAHDDRLRRTAKRVTS